MEYILYYINHVRRAPGQLHTETLGYHDITFVHKGSFEYEIDGECLTVNAGEALYVPKGSIRRRFAANTVFYTSLNFGIYPDRRLKLPRVMKHTDACLLSLYLRQLIAECEKRNRLRAEKISALLELIICELLEANPRIENDHVLEMLRHIDKNPCERNSVAELAQLVHLSQSRCSVIFKRECGISISEYVSRRRLELAAGLLRCGLSVSEAAEKSGYCDVYYFSRVFTSQLGITPTEYKRCTDVINPLPEYKVEVFADKIYPQIR